ncbi:MAG: (cytosine-5)-methyltransferase 1 [Sphingomonadales bacterium]|jgi:DNA (cytosine-5)-methyltransferase 1|nr:(cytosine-5)-methyltransferase 1 [Sphingomonadales bacterium]
MLLSLFCGCGGLDIGLEKAELRVGLAYELRGSAVRSYNRNLGDGNVARVGDVRSLTLAKLDEDFGSVFQPRGVVGGPPCQSFSRANALRKAPDARSELVREFFSLALALHRRCELDFIIMENVPEVEQADGGRLLERELNRLRRAGFSVRKMHLNAINFGVAQSRERLFVTAVNRNKAAGTLRSPPIDKERRTVWDAIGGLPEPIHFAEVAKAGAPIHPNHWCMTPRSRRFSDGSLTPGYSRGRSFKTLAWDQPSPTVSYGHREVHVHPNCRRRLSVYEAMLLQGFPADVILDGTLSDQLSQVSEAVPPPLAEQVALAVTSALTGLADQVLPARQLSIQPPAEEAAFQLSA